MLSNQRFVDSGHRSRVSPVVDADQLDLPAEEADPICWGNAAALFGHPAVADVAVIGVPDERWGEVGMAIIVRKADQDLEEGQVIRHCLGRLANFKVPQSVVFVDSLPRNATGKVLKRELRVQFVGTAAPAIS